MVAGRAIVCEPKTVDRYGRTVALCRVNGVDIGASMVRAGQAWAYVQQSHDYVREEAEPNAERVGFHAHDCLPAWDWRAIRQGERE